MELGDVVPHTGSLARINPERVAAFALALCRIPSPTGATSVVTEALGEEMRRAGMSVAFWRGYPATPVVIGRLRGRTPGKTLILNGHLDTVPIAHPEAERRDGRVYGRGSIDMKGPIAAGLEAVRSLAEAGCPFAGEIVLCAHGLHEAPGGTAEDLIGALRAGAITGDAAMVLEVGPDALPIAGMGSAVYRARFFRSSPVTHELMTPVGTPHPAGALADAIVVLHALAAELETRLVSDVGAESLFIGQAHCGDFFNRHPVEAWIEGTRRFSPESSPSAAEAELRERLAPVAAAAGLEFELHFLVVREGFRIDPRHPLVEALRSAFLEETGRTLPLTGIRIVADAPVFEKVGGIPCLYHGLAGHGAHGDLEWVAETELVRGARTYLRTILNYLGAAD